MLAHICELTLKSTAARYRDAGGGQDARVSGPSRRASNSSTVGLKMRQPGPRMNPPPVTINGIKYLFFGTPRSCKYL